MLFLVAPRGPGCTYDPLQETRWNVNPASGPGIEVRDQILFESGVNFISPASQLPILERRNEINGDKGG